MSKTIIFGYPGTGKTFKLISILNEMIESGIKPEDICFCTFTKSAADEIKSRAVRKFGFTKEQMNFFGTIHSLCFRQFCFKHQVITSALLSEFFKLKRIEYEDVGFDEDVLTGENLGNEDGNALFQFYNLIRVIECKNIDEIKDEDELKMLFHKMGKQEENFSKIFSNTFRPYEILRDYEKYKKENNLIDFADMLMMAYKSEWNIPTEILIVDEAQDLSPLQWKIYENWCKEKKEIYLAGDDDQSIYGFNGADYKRLLEEKNNADKVIILNVTHRISSKIHEYCLDYINKNISDDNRVVKTVISEKQGGEVIEEYIDEELEKILDFIRNGKTTFILFRTNNFKKRFISDVLVPKGLVYREIRGQSIWNERTINLFNSIIKLQRNLPLNAIEVKYMIDNIPSKFRLLKRGLKTGFKEMTKKVSYSVNDLLDIGFQMDIFSYLKDFKILNVLNLKDNIKMAFLNAKKELIDDSIGLYVGTIHSAKGREANDTILFKDITQKIAREITKDKESWENEIRVFHVGQTRPMERLVIIRGGFENSESNLIP